MSNRRPEDAIAVFPVPGADLPWAYTVRNTVGVVVAEGKALTGELARAAARLKFDELSDEPTITLTKWTVVGFTEDRGQNRVEYILALDAEQAAIRACEKNTQLQVVAVFEGRIVDQLASETACRWPLSDDEDEPGDDGRAA